ncbi:hypothetical protein [Marinomonas epiphytica]
MNKEADEVFFVSLNPVSNKEENASLIKGKLAKGRKTVKWD